jgi:hypothetical protein
VSHRVTFGALRRGRLDAGASDLGLQLLGRSLGNYLSPVDDPDPVGEHIGLLEVLRREEYGDALVAGEPAYLRPQRERLWGSSPVVGSSRKSIRGRCTSASARSSLLFIPPE